MCTCEVILLTNFWMLGLAYMSQYLAIGPNVDSPSDGIGGGKGGVNDAEDGAVAKPASMSGTKVVWYSQCQ